MAGTGRPTLRLRLDTDSGPQGEIRLAELAKVADQTQRIITHIAQRLVGDTITGRATTNIASATTLSLVGLRSGSTVLEIALPPIDDDVLQAEDMPVDIGQMALSLFAQGLCILAEDDSAPALPLGIDERVVQDIERWLTTLRPYQTVDVEAHVDGERTWAHISPRVARQALRRAEGPPDVPYVSAHHQALTGQLYALNLRTGTFKIEDGLGHSIPLVVPEHVRGDASQFIGRRVRVIGSATLDERHRLQSFVVSSLEETPEHFFRQSEFFDRHELIIPPRGVANSELDSGVIPDLSDDEITQFMLAFDEAN